MSVLRSTLVVSIGASASRVLGFVRDVLIAAALGAGPAADAFLIAYRIPNLVRRVLTEGGLNAAFVPLYLRLRGEAGADAAARFAADSLAGLALIALGLVASVELAAGTVVLALAAGYSGDAGTLVLATTATRLAFPFVAFATLAALLSALLAAERRFAAASLAPVAVNLMMIAVLVWLSAGALDPQSSVRWLAAAVSASGVLHLAIAAVAARPLRLPLRGARPRLSAPMRHLARVAGPALIASGAAQFIVLAGAEAASFQPSAVSWFYYAERVFQLPLGLIGAAAGLVLLPELALAARDDIVLSERQNRALETAMLVALPGALALVVLADPIVAVLFQRGAFGAEDARGTAAMLAGLGVGLPFAAAGKILSQGFFARGDLRSVVAASVLAMAVTFAAGLALAPRWGAGGIGAGAASGFAAHAVLLGALLIARGWWRPDRLCVGRVARGSGAAAVMAAGLVAALAMIGPNLDGGGDRLAQLGLAGLCLGGIILYGGACLAFGVVTRTDLAAWRRG